MPLVNQEAERIFRGMKNKNASRFKDLYGKRDKDVMYATANKLAQKKQTKQKTWKSGMGFKEEVVAEKCETRYCRLCRKKETRKQCSYGGALWDRYAVKDATKEEQKDAAEESGITSEGGEGMSEGTKSGDSSLRDWFSKSKSSDGKPGWVQLGGKYAGKPCARQPGQTTKPKCGSSKMKRNLNKDEEEAAFRRKNAKDPNPDRKGKAINVKTEATYPQDFRNADGSKRAVAKKKTGKPNAQGDYGKKDLNERGDYWHPDPDKDRKLGGPGANQRAREDRAAASKPKSDPKKLRKGESYMDYAKRQKGYTPSKPKKKSLLGRLGLKKEEIVLEKEGKKDACYHKVKSRYSVWPSAYASGALVKCRKKGAKNWGNSTKKEEFEGNLSFSDFQEKAQNCWKSHKKVGMKMKGGKLVNDCRPKNEEVTNEAKKCWKGYEKKGTQKLFGKTYNRCVKKEETQNEAAAWTRKAGKNKSGGLNEKGRKSYERENPGSDLKAPSKKVGNPRRASFCARMKGMKAKLTSKKTASDPDSRINKSLRAWNC